MKHFYLIILILISSTILFAQNSSITRAEIGMGTADIRPLSSKLSSPAWNLNLSTKIHLDKHIFRFGYVNRSGNYTYQTYSNYLFNIGYERRIPMWKFEVMYGVDAVYRSIRYFDRNITPEGYYFSSKHFGLGPIVGFAFNPIRRISIQTEFGTFFGPNTVHQYDGSFTLDNGTKFDMDYQRFVSINLYYSFGD